MTHTPCGEPTVEGAYQPATASSEAERPHIAEARTPKKAKRRGSKLVPPVGWDTRKLDIMRELLLTKFSTGSALAVRLVATGDAELIEGNLWGDRLHAVQQWREQVDLFGCALAVGWFNRVNPVPAALATKKGPTLPDHLTYDIVASVMFSRFRCNLASQLF